MDSQSVRESIRNIKNFKTSRHLNQDFSPRPVKVNLKIKQTAIPSSNEHQARPLIETTAPSTKHTAFKAKRNSGQRAQGGTATLSNTSRYANNHYQMLGNMVMSEPCSIPQSTKAKAMISLCNNPKFKEKADNRQNSGSKGNQNQYGKFLQIQVRYQLNYFFSNTSQNLAASSYGVAQGQVAPVNIANQRKIVDDSMNLSQINFTQDCSSLSPTSIAGLANLSGAQIANCQLIKQASSNTNQTNLNGSILVNKSVDLQQRIYRQAVQNDFASPTHLTKNETYPTKLGKPVPANPQIPQQKQFSLIDTQQNLQARNLVQSGIYTSKACDNLSNGAMLLQRYCKESQSLHNTGRVNIKGFNLKIRLKEETNQLRETLAPKRSQILNRSTQLSEPDSSNYGYPNKGNARGCQKQVQNESPQKSNGAALENSGAIETSQIVGDQEKLSDMSFQLNINEIIGSIDEKSELVKMKQELQSKDKCIAELLKRIEQLDGTVSLFRDPKSRDYTTASSGGKNGQNLGPADNSLFQGIQLSKVNKSMSRIGEASRPRGGLMVKGNSSNLGNIHQQRAQVQINNFVIDKETFSYIFELIYIGGAPSQTIQTMHINATELKDHTLWRFGPWNPQMKREKMLQAGLVVLNKPEEAFPKATSLSHQEDYYHQFFKPERPIINEFYCEADLTSTSLFQNICLENP